MKRIANGCGGNGAKFAEADALSKLVAAEGYAALEEAIVKAVQIGPRKNGWTGMIIPPGGNCQKWLSILGVKF